ncbi:uncharacterized protein LOC115764832 [Drosophila novamexicana]|uniref:uncharacterized protein LOC115764832 n=1 Tax=Drosophila novamexicana TaxID=47314 RepID=UPI0011E5BD47|nr:uncharacterized protein LOC115764832 [Drosophila novamexicana]
MACEIKYTIFCNYLLQSGLLLLMLNNNVTNGTIFKLTNAVCESHNKSWVEINQCRLKAVQRNKAILNINLYILYPAYDIKARAQILTKANGYKPWLFDVTVDVCKFMRKNNNPTFKLIFDNFKNFTTLNHTCPYYGNQIVKDYYPTVNRLIKFPTADYLFILTFIFHKQKTIEVKVYFSIVEDLI